MLGLKIDAAKGLFFDRAAILAAGERARLSVSLRFGAYVRTRDRSSQRKRKAISLAGRPPSVHVGYVRDFTFFVYDTSTQSVIIGPALVDGAKTSPTVPELLEKGGETTILVHGTPRKAIYQPRPHTVPAFETELRNLPALLAGSIRK